MSFSQQKKGLETSSKNNVPIR